MYAWQTKMERERTLAAFMASSEEEDVGESSDDDIPLARMLENAERARRASSTSTPVRNRTLPLYVQ